MRKPVQNIGASVRARLLNLAKERNQPFELLLIRYTLERLLYRLSTSKHRERFALKGAMLMRHWLDDPHRPTRDLDLLGFGDSDPELTLKIFREICAVKADDAVVFDVDGLVVDRVRDESGYSGLRLKTYATVDGARVRVVIDIGYGDAPPEQELGIELFAAASMHIDHTRKICNSSTDTLSESIMPTSTRFAVAVHTLAALAVSDGKPMRSEDLAYSVNTSPVVIRGLLSRLSDAGLTRSQLGTGGGALLARPAGKIRLLDVYEAVEDTELFSLHRTPPCESCAVGGNILEAMQPTLTRARKALENELAKVTIAAIAAEVARLGKFSIPLVW